MTIDEYLDQEELAPVRHVYRHGVVTEIDDEYPAYSALGVALLAEIHLALRKTGHVVVGINLLLRTGTLETLLYPDVMVFGEKPQTMEGHDNVVTNPIFAAEIMSPDTEAFDRGVKASEYRLTPSILQYALVSMNPPWVEIYSRAEGGWTMEDVHGLDSVCEFPSIGCRIPMASLFERGHRYESPAPFDAGL